MPRAALNDTDFVVESLSLPIEAPYLDRRQEGFGSMSIRDHCYTTDQSSPDRFASACASTFEFALAAPRRTASLLLP
jgi:hypothetical protein